MQKQKTRVGISIGDLNGIGAEVVLKTLRDARILEFCTPVIFASAKTISFLKNHFKYNINFNGVHAFNKIVEGKINVYNTWKDTPKIEFGKENTAIGALAIKSLQVATKALKEGAIDVLVTAPINKLTIQSEDFKFPGHTDYLAEQLEGESLMFMVTDTLRVGLITDHVPVKDVTEHITEALITKKVNAMHDSLVKDFEIRKPKIAVLGINPHTGDNGVIGSEDDTVLRPALAKIKESGKLVFGPYAADSFFGSDNYKSFDAILATYHDQGLIPFKTLSFGKGVNFTAGLNKVRTSPDHGTAYEIAGKGTADESSFKEALFMGIRIFKNRKLYSEITANPLKISPKKQDYYICRLKIDVNMKKLKDFTIQFVGLKDGKHQFDYNIDKAFFEIFEYDEFNDAAITAHVELNKKPTLLEFNFKIDGTVNLNCDLTNEAYAEAVNDEFDLVVKFGDEYNNENEEILIIPHGEYEITIAQYIYELIVLSLPSKRIHPGVIDGSLKSAHPKRKISKTRRDKRRTHYKATVPQIATCPTTGESHLYHRAHWHEGKLYYRGQVLIDNTSEENLA